MRGFLQICVLFIAANRISGQAFYRGRQRGMSFRAPTVRSTSFRARPTTRFGSQRLLSSPVGHTQSFGRIRQQELQPRGSFRPSLDRTGSRLGSSIHTSHRSTARVSGGIREDPQEIRNILGSSILGRELRMGERGLPRHGGAGAGEEHANGLMRGWDGNPQTLGNRFENEWSDPFQGRPVPRLPNGFRGDFGSIPGMRTWG